MKQGKFDLVMKKFCRRFSKNDDGIAAIEFAAILPFLLLLVLGISEFTDAYNARKKSNNANNIIGDMFAQFGTVSAKDGKGIFDIAMETIDPFPGPANFTSKVFMVTYDDKAKQEVAWGWEKGKACKPKDSSGLPALPSELAIASTSWVVVTSELTDNPILTAIFIDKIGLTFNEVSYYRPRVANEISAC